MGSTVNGELHDLRRMTTSVDLPIENVFPYVYYSVSWGTERPTGIPSLSSTIRDQKKPEREDRA
jgi:hypothetical protein